MDYKKSNQLRLLGMIIAYYRKSRGMTQQALADAISISRTHMSNIEAPNVPTSISISTLLDIADVLDVPVEKFFQFQNFEQLDKNS